jgi:hypothetical protein
MEKKAMIKKNKISSKAIIWILLIGLGCIVLWDKRWL